jgi:conjugative relaxase-like TrwC/TraI family protein
MLKISQSLGSSQVKDYYTKEYLAKENYWQQDAEAPGEWHGKLAEDMGLTGAIDYQSFSNLADGRNAAGDTQLVRHIDREGYTNEQGTFVRPVEHRAAWDAVFSAPKSVSLTALVGGDERIIEAHRQAVDVALSRLEAFTQARVSTAAAETTGKMLAAKFEHQTSRPVDGYTAPQLHTHVVMFNMTQRADGQFNALQTKALFDSQQYATAIYQAELTYQLRNLGYTLETGKSGAPEIKGYSKEYLQASSPRREQIEDYLDKNGLSGPAAAANAAQNTRDKKQLMTQEEILAAHKELAATYGNQADNVVSEAAKNHALQTAGHAVSNQATGTTAVQFSQDKNFEREAVIDERALTRDALRRGMGEVRIGDVETALAANFAKGELQTVSRENRPEIPARLVTSQNAIDAERSIVHTMQTGQSSVEPIMQKDAATAQSNTRDYFNEAQRRTIQEVLTSPDRVHGLQGMAGTGKTTVLETIRDGAQQNGYVVQGFAPTSKATGQLREAGISADTLQGFLTKGGEHTGAKHLYMLDESSLASTIQMRQFMNKLGPEDRILFVGDTRQHQGVDAGKPFEQLQQAGMRTSQLDQIVRQRNEPELLKAVEHLSRNETAAGIKLLEAQGRVHEIKDATERIQAIAADYVQRPQNTLVISPDNATRRELNLAIRESLQDSGAVSKQGHAMKVLVNRSDITGTERAWAARYDIGDVLQYQKGSREHDIAAKSFARVVDVDSAKNLLTVEKQDGQRVEYNPERLKGVNIYKELDREFATGDRLQFTAPDKKLGVANRDLATIEAITPATAAQASQITVKMDAGHSITFDPQKMRNFDHGYAVTSHSSQGLTSDRVLVNMDTDAPSQLLNTRFAYVSLSRGQSDAQIYTNDASRLPQTLSADITKESAIDAKALLKEPTTHDQAEAIQHGQELTIPSAAHGPDPSHQHDAALDNLSHAPLTPNDPTNLQTLDPADANLAALANIKHPDISEYVIDMGIE